MRQASLQPRQMEKTKRQYTSGNSWVRLNKEDLSPCYLFSVTLLNLQTTTWVALQSWVFHSSELSLILLNQLACGRRFTDCTKFYLQWSKPTLMPFPTQKYERWWRRVYTVLGPLFEIMF